MYLTTSPRMLRWVMPRELIWEIPGQEKVLYLTFDDGPVAGVTDKALGILDRFNAKATFFCVGDNVRKFPDIFRQVVEAGHAVGNHTFHHLNGWKTPDDEYFNDVKQCAELIDSKLFRPPYGRITRRQAKILSTDYKIFMWSVLSDDFDPLATAETCFNNIKKSTHSGSIIVMHDQQKSAKTMLNALPRILAHYSQKGFTFLPIKMI
jgi:peptidoglycan-N-acetylglucosamine deacetylase